MKFYSAALNVHSFEMYLECCTPPHPHPPPVWASASSKWRYFKTVLWHDSCVYALVLLFPTICFMFPPSTLPLCFQPELYLWLIAAIKTGSCWEWEEGLLSHFPSHSCFFHSLSVSRHYFFLSTLPTLVFTLDCSHDSGLVLRTTILIDRRSTVKYVYKHWKDYHDIFGADIHSVHMMNPFQNFNQGYLSLGLD